MKLSIIVPCYNESNNLDRLVEAFRDALQDQSEIELILVDNGSRDDTPQRLQNILSRPENAFARSVRVEINQGYGHGILFGLREAKGEFLAWTHADLQTPPADVLRALQEIDVQADPQRSVIRGRRMGRPWFDQLFTTVMGWVASAALSSYLHDVNAQPKVFHRTLLAQLPQAPDDFTLDLYLLHRANQLGLKVKTVDVRFDRRTAGLAKGGGSLAGKYRLCKRTLAQIWKLRKSLKSASHNLDRIELLEAALGDCRAQIANLRNELFDVPNLPSLRFLSNPLEDRLEIARRQMDAFLPAHEQLSDDEHHYLLMQMFFRGSVERVNDDLSAILSSVQVDDATRCLPVWDIGCGRGELLQLLKANGFHATGVDTSALMVKKLRERKLEAVHGDAIAQLQQLSPGGLCGLTAFHVIEHFEPNCVTELLNLAYEKLAPGGFLLLETPNPFCFESLSYFYTDATHVRPIQPFQLAFMVESAGFVNTRAHFSAPVPVARRQSIDNWLRYYQNHGIVAFKPRVDASLSRVA